MKLTGTHPQLEIIYEDNHLLTVNKPPGVLSQEDYTGKPDVLSLCKQYLKQEYNKPGNVFLGLVHRLDKPVSGVMLLAKTSKAASRISQQIRDQSVEKTYLAVVEGVTPKNGFFSHFLKKDNKLNRVSIVDGNVKGGKESRLTYQTIAHNKNLSLVEIHLLTGRPHQIRVQFSVEGFPIWGDKKYGNSKTRQIALHAFKFKLQHPTLKKSKTIQANPPDSSPWNLFKSSFVM